MVDAEMLFEQITVIEAQEQLKSFSVADWPNMKQSHRDKTRKELYQKAYPKHLRKKNFVSAEEVQKLLSR